MFDYNRAQVKNTLEIYNLLKTFKNQNNLYRFHLSLYLNSV